jgi:hypothetical protein
MLQSNATSCLLAAYGYTDLRGCEDSTFPSAQTVVLERRLMMSWGNCQTATEHTAASAIDPRCYQKEMIVWCGFQRPWPRLRQPFGVEKSWRNIFTPLSNKSLNYFILKL